MPALVREGKRADVGESLRGNVKGSDAAVQVKRCRSHGGASRIRGVEDLLYERATPGPDCERRCAGEGTGQVGEADRVTDEIADALALIPKRLPDTSMSVRQPPSLHCWAAVGGVAPARTPIELTAIGITTTGNAARKRLANNRRTMRTP